MKYHIYADGVLVGQYGTIGGAKRSAIARSKKEKQFTFYVRDFRGRTHAKYRNGNEQWIECPSFRE